MIWILVRVASARRSLQIFTTPFFFFFSIPEDLVPVLPSAKASFRSNGHYECCRKKKAFFFCFFFFCCCCCCCCKYQWKLKHTTFHVSRFHFFFFFFCLFIYFFFFFFLNEDNHHSLLISSVVKFCDKFVVINKKSSLYRKRCRFHSNPSKC